MKVIIVILFLALSACVRGPVLPENLNGQAALVMGYSSDFVRSDAGGMVYTGMAIESVNDEKLLTPLKRGDYLLVAAGEVRLQGACWWRLRGNINFEDDVLEPLDYIFKALPNHVYTLAVDIDNYKYLCDVSFFESVGHQ